MRIYLWIIGLSIQFGRGQSDCREDLMSTRYSGTVSVTNNGHRCQAWSTQTPHEHSITHDDMFPDDGSVEKAKNYCRNVWEGARPWCHTMHPDIEWGFCDYSICPDLFRECGGVVNSASGSLTAPDFDGSGRYDFNLDCLWAVHAPKNYVIRYKILFFKIEDELSCSYDVLMIFEKGVTNKTNYCGSSGTQQIEGETKSNILYVQFYSDADINDRGFNITFRQLKAPNMGCGEVLMQNSGWISSPDRDGDGLYDFNLNCTWIIHMDEDKFIAFRILFIDIYPSTDCYLDYLRIYDYTNVFNWYCYKHLINGSEILTTSSNMLFVDFVTDNINARSGFRLEYEELDSKPCLDDLTGYNGTVSVTNHGKTCQAWSSQSPHPHNYNKDRLFPMDGSVTGASNYCRDIVTPGRPWCYTMDRNTRWSYCTFTICNGSGPLCLTLVRDTMEFIKTSIPWRNGFTSNTDCLVSIQVDENHVINYVLSLEKPMDQDQCEAYALILFDKGKSLPKSTFCDTKDLYFEGETRANILNIQYYKDSRLFPIVFGLAYIQEEAQKRIWNETLRIPSGWIISPDIDGDGSYDFYLDCFWAIEGEPNSIILMTPVFISIELSPGCAHDFILIYDDYGHILTVCGEWIESTKNSVESRLNRLYVQFTTNGIIGFRGFNYSFEIRSMAASDCLKNLLTTDYTGTVSVTNHGYTCQAWASQSPHRHDIFSKDDPAALTIFNYCRSFPLDHAPWCFTTDPYIRWGYCTYSICNEAFKKCDDVLQSSTGFIISPDYDTDGLYDLNLDCLWVVEAPAYHVIQFDIYFVDIESSSSCVKDFLQIFERNHYADRLFVCGVYGLQTGETKSNALYVQFYSDHSRQYTGFNMSYVQLEAPDKYCTETFRERSGWIIAPDADSDGFYDFNLNCFWTVEVEPNMLISFEFVYVDLENAQDVCRADYIEVSDGFGPLIRKCGTHSETPAYETRSNVMFVTFRTNNLVTSRGFHITFNEFERNTDCFDELRSVPYSGTINVTNNGLLCQAWSDLTPHNHSENRDDLFPVDKSVSKAKNYCRDIWGDGRPWCYTKDKEIRKGFCNLKICKENVQPCGSVLHIPTGIITPPDRDADTFYDLNVDCLWIIEAAKNKVIRHTIDTYDIEDSSECHKDALWIYESWMSTKPIICGTRTQQLVGETVTNKLYVHFYSDESIAFKGFQLFFTQKEVSSLPCDGVLNLTYGWLSAPDRDGDGLYDFNINCLWTVETQDPKQIKFQVLYELLDYDDGDSDFLKIDDNEKFDAPFVFYGSYWNQITYATRLNKLYIQFVTNNLDVGYGFNLTYEEIEQQYFNFKVSGSGWITPPDLNKDGLYDLNMQCTWNINVHEHNAIELELYYIKINGIYPYCYTDSLLIIDTSVPSAEKFCGSRGRQAVVQTYGNYVFLLFHSDFMDNDIGFLLDYKAVNGSKKSANTDMGCPGWISSLDANLDGLYDYHLKLLWNIRANDSNIILLKLLYIDIEESQGCINDFLAIHFPVYYGTICGTGFKKVITTFSQGALLYFNSDHTVNRFGFNMSFSQITSAVNGECDSVLTGSSGYITSTDANFDGQYDGGLDCQWSIALGYSNVIVLDVLKQDIHQSKKSPIYQDENIICGNDFLMLYEDHRVIGKYCGKSIVPRFTTESNILYVLFTTDLFRSARGFEAVYFQAEDVNDCLPDYKCLLTDSTVQQEYICDSYRDCPNGDDERFCDFRCPHGCLCIGLSIDCTGTQTCGFDRQPASFLNQTFVLSSTTRILDASTNHEMFLYLNLKTQDLPFLTHLNLSSCEITDLPFDIFLSMKNLKVLDLTFNKIRALKAKAFQNQEKLELILLRGNSEPLIIESEAFFGLVSLRYLDLSTLKIERISSGSFATLHLKALTVYGSHVTDIQSNSLDKLDAEAIYFNSSTIDTFIETMFQGASNIDLFVTDEYKFCCVRPLSVQEEKCYPQKDEFSSCDDLVRNKVLRPLILVVGFSALLSNVGSIIYRFRHHAGQLKFCYGKTVLHLAASDSLLGIYLIMIGITDIFYRGIYIFHDESWRESAWCQLAGVLSTVSCEASILLSFVITVDRYLAIKYPFRQKRLTGKNGTVLAIVCWSIALFLAILPVTLHSYFKGQFYSKSGLCLALPLTRARPPGWGYAFGIFVVFNSLTCLLIAIGQWSIYREIKSLKKALGDSRTKSTTNARNARITRNLLLVVTTNFLCWLPVGFLGVMALADYAIPGNVYQWIAVLVLPINSAVNPVLYTLSEMLQKKKVFQRQPDSEKTKCMFTAADLNNCTDLWKSSAFCSFKRESPEFTSLTEVLMEDGFCRKQRICVFIAICKLLQKLHEWKLTQESLTTDEIFIKRANERRCKVVLLCRPEQMMYESSQDENILSLGQILSTLIREACKRK